MLRAGVVDQDAPHQLRSNSIKMCAVLPLGAPLIDEPEISLIDQRRWLQSVFLPFTPEVVPGKSAQFAVDKGHQLVEGCLVAATPTNQELCYSIGRLHDVGSPDPLRRTINERPNPNISEGFEAKYPTQPDSTSMGFQGVREFLRSLRVSR